MCPLQPSRSPFKANAMPGHSNAMPGHSVPSTVHPEPFFLVIHALQINVYDGFCHYWDHFASAILFDFTLLPLLFAIIISALA